MSAEETPVGPRNAAAAVTGVIAGTAGFALLLLAGWLLQQRLWPDSAVALVVVLIMFGAAGAFAGWMFGLIVFSAVRDSGEPSKSDPT